MVTIDFNTMVFGARLFYWLYLLVTLFGGIGIYVYWQREQLRKFYYSLRFPEKLLKINIFYPGNTKQTYYRLIPNDISFSIDGGTYLYDADAIIKNNDWYAFRDKKKLNRLIVRIEDKEYYLDDLKNIKVKREAWPELYYKFDCPFPIDINGSIIDDGKTNIKLKSTTLEDFKKSTLLTQVWTALENPNLIIFVLVLVVISLIIGGVTMGKVFGWIKAGAP